MEDLTASRRLALLLLGMAGVLAIVCVCLVLCTYYSTGPFNGMLGGWAQQAHFMTYRGGSTGMERNGQFWCILSGLLSAAALLPGVLSYLNWRYQNSPD